MSLSVREKRSNLVLKRLHNAASGWVHEEKYNVHKCGVTWSMIAIISSISLDETRSEG